MQGPDLGVVCLEWAGRSLVLRYPLGALRELALALGSPSELAEIYKLSRKLDLDTLPVWVWAGLLHQDRSLDREKVAEWISWPERSGAMLALYDAVGRAFELAMNGSLRDPEVEKKQQEAEMTKDPKATTASTKKTKPGRGLALFASRLRSWLAKVLKRSGGGGR